MTPGMATGEKRADEGESELGTEQLHGAERRRAQRVLVNIEVDYASEDTYLLANITDISATGIFVRTTTPSAVGTRLNLRFSPPDTDAPFELEGEVAWVNPYRPTAYSSIHPGMGIRFVALDPSDQTNLEYFVRRIAYLA